MSGVASNIPLASNAVGNFQQGYGNALAGANQLLQLQQQQAEVARQNKLRGILGAEGAIDPATGVPKPETMNQVMGVDPAAGMKLQQNALAMQQQKLQMDRYKTQTFADQFKQTSEISDEAYTAYKQALDSGKDETAARAVGQQVLTDGQQRLATGGGFSADQQKSWPRQFDPVQAAAHVQTYNQWQAHTEKEKSDKIAAEREARQEKHDADVEGRTGTTVLQDSTGRPIVLKPNAPAGQPKATYLDGTPVKDEDLPGAHKMGSGTTSPAAADRAATENVTKSDYEKELGRPVNPNDPAEKAELDRRVLAAEDKRAADKAGSIAKEKMLPGSVAADRAAIAADVNTDPNFQGKSTGEKAAEVEHRYQVARTATMDPEVATNLARQYVATGNVNVFGGFRRNTQMMNQIEKSVIEEQARQGKTPDQVARQSAEFSAFTQGVKAFEAGGKLEPVVRSQNVAVQHLGVLQDAADALGNKNLTAFNSLKNKIAEVTGQEAPTDFNGVKRIVGTELVKAITGSAGALGDREALDADLKAANSPAQLTGLINKYKQLMAGQLSGLRQSYDRLDTGESFDKRFLAPETQKQIAKYAPAPPVPAPPGATAPQQGAAPVSPPPGGWKVPNQKAIDAVKADPKLAEHFIQAFGPDAAAKNGIPAPQVAPQAGPRTTPTAQPPPAPAQQAAPPAQQPTAPTTEGAAPPKFVEGKVYVDKQGNRAVYKNGKFVDVK